MKEPTIIWFVEKGWAALVDGAVDFFAPAADSEIVPSGVQAAAEDIASIAPIPTPRTRRD
ncbi:MAG: hypothetical protein ACXV5Q_15055 [Frankiaceae bacterium]